MASHRMWLAAFALWLGCGDSSAGATVDAHVPGRVDIPADAGAPSSDRDPPSILLDFEPLDLGSALDRPTALGFIPGADGEFLVLEQRRRVAHYRLDGDAAALLGSFTLPDLYDDRDCGFIALAFDPHFADNGSLYISMCVSETHSGVFRFEFDPSDYSRIADTMDEVILVGDDRAEFGIHNVGSLGFDRDDNLWVLFGEKTFKGNARNPENNLGAVLRIVPRSTGDGYDPAPGNPNDDNPNLYAYGFRSPWRGVMDHLGRLWVGDVGGDDFEEVDLILEPGGNYGWPSYQGPCKKNCTSLIDPVASWSFEDDHPYVLDDEDAEPTTRRVAWLGAVYKDTGLDPYAGELTDRLLFGDLCSGFIRLLEVDSLGRVVHDTHVGHQKHLTGADQAPDGFLYVLSYGGCGAGKGSHPGGAMYRVVPKG